MTSSPAITPTTGADSIANFEEQKDKQDEQDWKSLGINIIRPVDLSKITDAETHNAEKQGKFLGYRIFFIKTSIISEYKYRSFINVIFNFLYMLHC